jgi:hypothetical protein
LKESLKKIRRRLNAQITLLQTITGHRFKATPYTSQTIVLVKIINNMSMLRSLALLDFQVLYTCGINVTDERNEPKCPTISTQVINYKLIRCETRK